MSKFHIVCFVIFSAIAILLLGGALEHNSNYDEKPIHRNK
jgi:hypothetical protein